LRIVGHAREQPAQLDCGRHLALLLEGGTRIAAASASETTNISASMGMEE
jgi:hypothetical protein